MIGHTAQNKYVPTEAYTAPMEFIKGLINPPPFRRRRAAAAPFRRRRSAVAVLRVVLASLPC